MSSSIFNGDVIVPGEAGRGLSASLTLDAGAVTLTTESDVLGRWSEEEYEVQPTVGGEFRLTLGGEDILFRPEAPAAFATAVLPEGTRVPRSEEDAHHESWDVSSGFEELLSAGSTDSGVESLGSAPVPEFEASPTDENPMGATEPDLSVAPVTQVHSYLDQGLDDGIITAGFLRVIVVVSAALVTFALIAILLV